MRRNLTILSVFVAVSAAFLGLMLCGPAREHIGRLNTVCSSRFTPDRYAQIKEGVARQTVLELLGPPLQSHDLDWSGGIESLSFSQPKWNADYESVVVWIGSDGNVTWHGRAVTD